jgi:hypothetical protein
MTANGTRFQFPSRKKTEVQFSAGTGYRSKNRKVRRGFSFRFPPVRKGKPYEKENCDTVSVSVFLTVRVGLKDGKKLPQFF